MLKEKLFLVSPVLVFLMFISCSEINSNSDHPAYKTRFQEQAHQLISEKIEYYKIPGLAYLILKNDEIISEKNYGVANVEFDIPVTDSTIFQLASVTKIFTGTVIMKLHETGVLSIDDPVTKYIDYLPQNWNDIKIKHLLNHTSGIANHFRTKEWMELRCDQQDKLNLKEAIEFSANTPLQFSPGSQWSYSVTGYMVLGLLAEEVTGSSIEVLAKDLLFRPLEMNQTVYGDYRAVIKNRNSQVYTFQNGPFETWNFTYGQAGTTAAGLNSTLSDLEKFFKAFDSNLIIKKETLHLAFAPAELSDGNIIEYGLGWDIKETQRGIKFYGHEGGGCCWIYYFPEEHLTFIILTNLTASKADDMIDELINLYFDSQINE